MFDPLVLGVDPGTASVGLALVRRGGRRADGSSVIWAGTIRTRPGADPSLRLRAIHQQVREVIEREHPDVMAIERLMWGRNAPSGMEVARAAVDAGDGGDGSGSPPPAVRRAEAIRGVRACASAAAP